MHLDRKLDWLRDVFLCKDSNLITVTEHGGENILQEGQDMLVGFKQTPHRLQFHDLCIWALCDWEIKQKYTWY